MNGQEDLAIEYSRAVLHTNLGDITVALFVDKSPKTVNNFLNLAKAGEYDGTKFHRIIVDFMIQGGDLLSKDDSKVAMWGTGGPNYRFEDEFNDEPLVRGSLAMANAGPNTNGSQFFIVTAPETPWLNGKHTNFGEVVEGMNVVETIEKVSTGPQDRPLIPIVVESVELVK
ncbi:MAG: peptidylprolyl isomerase [Candidatus Magasanikbacteria bacterium CG1_02_41_34]|nr:MAG: peptidylprolyl isomerase [Candidatus Magasanikbacteria bacterium CG1_02_41_34]